MKTTNLFAAPTVKEPAKKATDKKVINAEILDDKIKRFAELKQLIDNAIGELKMIEGDIKQVGRETFLREYRKNKIRPDSFKLADATGNQCMFIAMDKYTTVDETKAEVLEQFDGLLDENLTFTINPEMINKYGQVLSDLICKSKLIEEEDKAILIKGEKQYTVKKGSIDRLMQYENMEEVFELINPIVMLKK